MILLIIGLIYFVGIWLLYTGVRLSTDKDSPAGIIAIILAVLWPFGLALVLLNAPFALIDKVIDKKRRHNGQE